ncbi:MAG: NAD(P)H-hydrate dehydratase [Paracoccus sp. (in: a-proteobacteria)]|uniref:NAD(P)H-hydrate dehydratase n=1 Tax=Paracoccus sp. TaxID=267 RepID=UPI0040594987
MMQDTEIITCAQMRAIESAAMGSGTVSGLDLMTRAGRAVAGQIRLRWPRPGRVKVLCGPGNNGGDGYVVAMALADAGCDVHVLGDPPPPGSDAATARAYWSGPVRPLTCANLCDGPSSDVYVDAIFGTGLTRPPEGEIATVLRHLGGNPDLYRPRLVAVDAPSGLCLDSGQVLGAGRGSLPPDALRVAVTVTFDSPRPGHLLEHGPTACGTLVVEDIGLEPFRTAQAATLTVLWPRFRIDDRRLRPSEDGDWLRKKGVGAGHKYSHGSALVIAGGPGTGGAARLAARAALRVGAGLVTLGPTPDALAEHALPPDALMRRPIADADALREMLSDQRLRGLCIGPGCGVPRAKALLPAACAAGRPMVLDADALTAFAEAPLPLPRDSVLTPHQGEFTRVFPDLAEDLSRSGGADKVSVLRLAAQRTGAIVLLKGPDTIIAAPDGQAAIHSDANIPWLATAGAGDVLAGMIAGLLARGLPSFKAACLGVSLHAAAARYHGPGLIADDLPEVLPTVLQGWPNH